MISRFIRAVEFSDLNITCDDHIYRVHKLVLCTRSQFFANALNFPGKVSGTRSFLQETILTTCRNTQRAASIYQTMSQQLSS